MRVLVIHNKYRSSLPSGENEVVAAEVDSLRGSGVEVDTYFRSSDEIEGFGLKQRVSLPARPIYSLEDVRQVRCRIRKIRPDLVHLHNPFPLISPAVVRVAKSEGLPVVQTVHNYRHSCPAGDFFRNGAVCESCSGLALPWPSVVHGCYRGSRVQSSVMAAAALMHRTTWRKVDRYLAVSGFVADHLATFGVPRERIQVRYNSTASLGSVRPLGSGFLFVGRLTKEKGVSLLISAWMQSDLWRQHRLVVVGDGPERDLVLAAGRRNVEFLGLVDRSRVSALLDQAAVVVVPSLWYEGFPRLVAEAFERGRPVAATALGSLEELITPDVGWTAPPEASAFGAMLAAAISDPALRRKAERARAVFESELNQRATTASLIGVYESVVESQARSGRT